jgi:hypothetical protein
MRRLQPESPVTRNGGRNIQVADGEPRTPHALGDYAPMTVPMVQLETHQTRSRAVSNPDGCRQIALRGRRLHVCRENAAEVLVAPLARRESPRLRIAETLQVNVGDPGLPQRVRQCSLGEAWLARDRNVAHVD